jgi:threonine aldolase
MSHKYSFFNDYSEGAHQSILLALQETNLQQETGYGEDSLSQQASDLIREKIGNPDADIHFVSGGTQANLIVLASLMKPYESVIAANTGHIFVHEAGAIEVTGHKINTIETDNGKITPDQIKAVLDQHEDEHMVKPKVVFISNSTEVGTIYSKEELQAISEFCRNNGLYLYLDGARLGSALTSSRSDLSLSDLSSLVDIFYIGGTKNGALLGEVIVINNDQLKENFRYHLKQRGALLAKGRVLGIQFLKLFESDLYFDLAMHANKMAAKLTQGIRDQGYDFLTDSPTNQIFPIFPNVVIDRLKEMYGFYIWSKVDENKSSIRLVTSWATKEEAVDGFLEDLKNLATQ